MWTLSAGVPIGCRSPRKRGPYSMPKHTQPAISFACQPSMRSRSSRAPAKLGGARVLLDQFDHPPKDRPLSDPGYPASGRSARALPEPSRDRPGAIQRFSHELPPACAASPVLTDAFNGEPGDCSNIERERPSLRRRFRRMRSSQPLPPVSSRSHQYLRPPP